MEVREIMYWTRSGDVVNSTISWRQRCRWLSSVRVWRMLPYWTRIYGKHKKGQTACETTKANLGRCFDKMSQTAYDCTIFRERKLYSVCLFLEHSLKKSAGKQTSFLCSPETRRNSWSENTVSCLICFDHDLLPNWIIMSMTLGLNSNARYLLVFLVITV